MAPRGRVAQGPKLRTEFAEMDTPTPMLSMLVCRVCVRCTTLATCFAPVELTLRAPA